MANTKYERKIYAIIFVIILVLTMVFTPLTAYATSIRDSSDVLADLKQDPNFHTDAYPVVSGDAAINFMHLAESEQGEVLIYVYQPHSEPAKYKASSINISATTDESLDIKNYYLDLVDYDGVFQKYVVRDLAALSGSKREYEVVSIYRMYDAAVDAKLDDDNGNSINEVVYPVAKKYTFTNTPEGLSTGVSDLQYITVTDKYVGFMRYPAGSVLFSDLSVDVHFVAFSTDYHMDQLLEADVYYVQQRYDVTGVASNKAFGSREEKYSYLNTKTDLVYDRGRWWSTEYSWNTIETPAEFLASTTEKTLYKKGVFDVWSYAVVDDAAKAEIESQEWVLRFAHTEYLQEDKGTSVPHTDYHGYTVGEVTILRLAFETNGQYYNLPVIDNKQTGSLTPSNEIEYEVQASEWWQKIMMLLGVILVVVVISVLSGPIRLLLNIIFTGTKFLISVVFWIVSLPFKLIGRLLFRRQ